MVDQLTFRLNYKVFYLKAYDAYQAKCVTITFLISGK